MAMQSSEYALSADFVRNVIYGSMSVHAARVLRMAFCMATGRMGHDSDGYKVTIRSADYGKYMGGLPADRSSMEVKKAIDDLIVAEFRFADGRDPIRPFMPTDMTTAKVKPGEYELVLTPEMLCYIGSGTAAIRSFKEELMASIQDDELAEFWSKHD